MPTHPDNIQSEAEAHTAEQVGQGLADGATMDPEAAPGW